MSTTKNQPITEGNKPFDIYKKLNDTGSYWSLMFNESATTKGLKYNICMTYEDHPEFALYKKVDGYFLLVDFFSEYELANKEAKEIIDSHEKFKKFILTNQGGRYED